MWNAQWNQIARRSIFLENRLAGKEKYPIGMLRWGRREEWNTQE